MPEGDRYVIDGSLLRCDKGVLVTPLTVLPRASHVTGRYQANVLDCVPVVNIKPFGVCAITHSPCMPVMPFWTQAHPAGRTIYPGPAAPLLESSICQCGLGGRISVTVLPVPGVPALGSGGAGLLRAGEELGQQRAAHEQAQDAEAHAESAVLKDEAAKVAAIGFGLALAGLAFPPLEVAASVFMAGAEVLLVAAVAEDTLVAIEHPTQDNWVMVGGDALALATGYVVGKVIAGPIVRGVRALLSREAGAETATLLPKTQQAADEVLHRAGPATGDELADEVAAREAAAQQAKHAADKLAAEQAKVDKRADYQAKTPEQLATEKAAKEARKQRGAEKQRQIDKDNAAADAAKHRVPHQPSRTLPSRDPDPNAKPTGPETRLKGDAEQQRGLRRENESAVHVARAGYRIEQNPKVPGTKNPDYRIEDKIFDGYSPKSNNLEGIGTNMAEKVNDEQARRLLVNLDDAPEIRVEDVRVLSRQLQQNTAPKLEEVWVWKDGQLHTVFP